VSLPDMIPVSDLTAIVTKNLLPSSAIVSIGTIRPPRTRRATTRYAAAVSMSDAFATDVNNKPLTYRSARRGSDSSLWRIEESKEIIRLIDDTRTMKFIHSSLKPLNR